MGKSAAGRRVRLSGIGLVASLLLAACAKTGGGGTGSSAPQAQFSATGSVGDAPLTVVFTDTSTGEVTSWSWDFGDGGVSSERSPVHTYAAIETFTVTLEVAGPDGTSRRDRKSVV